MHEIEIKLQVPPAHRAAVDAAVAGSARAARRRLQATYQDTPDRRLAEAGLALRLRREGRQWIQTLKGAGDDGLTRLEHNVARGNAAAMPPVDPSLHAGTPAGERLLALLAASPGAGLASLYGTDILRRTRTVAHRVAGRPGARIELAFDHGRITSAADALPVCELELELLTGSPLVLIAAARTWVSRHGLWFDGRSKAERGDLLARGTTVAPPRMARPPALPKDATPAAAWQLTLRNCAEQVLANASQIASGAYASEHVHQLRVGLRRLRSAIALYEHPDAALGEGAAGLFRGLGAARDAEVVQARFGPALATATKEAGLPAAPEAVAADDAPASLDLLLRSEPSQTFLLDLLAAMHAEPGPVDDIALRTRLANRLDGWHRHLLRGARHYADLDDERRHALRKQAKRLRYAAEFCGPLFRPKAVRRYVKALRALQERLGEVSDVSTAMAMYRLEAERAPRALFALGWLTGQHALRIAEALPSIDGFRGVRRFWK